ncbi:NF-kappa-B essential modulator isoform X1 [Lucilia cuprina]|uniref:NF-kappa-B essential modulator isoform X1 n=1 Tax=Lucilia cuprina TaxID=7375 RepID=UPI001F05380D|nr:NF-kappa-B essential modulator isoform X1 [Lucilia cuprina]
MSDEESFVILGSSPMSSLEIDGIETKKNPLTSLESDTPGSRFTSLKRSQISDLHNAQEMATQTHEENLSQPQMAISKEKSLIKEVSHSSLKSIITDPKTGMENMTPKPHDIQPEMAESVNKMQKLNISQQESLSAEVIAGSKLWSRQPQVQVEEHMMPISLEDCALKSPFEKEQKTDKNIKQIITNTTDTNYKSIDENGKSSSNSSKTTPPTSIGNNLASSFLMGEVNADVLKTSVYSQFPSISMEACAEDVVKLQNMVSEYTVLKNTIKKANMTMKQFYNSSLQWKEKMKTMEEEVDKCHKEIDMLRKHNQELEHNFKGQIEALEIARKKDREETIQEISEKNALVENMRAQIIKLEEQQLASFEFVAQNQSETKNNEQFQQLFITRQEHELKMKQLERQLSEMLASNLDLKDVQKQYIDEINCLKVNLTAAEELIKKHRNEIAQLHVLDIEKQQEIEKLEQSLGELRATNEEQSERITLLEHQNEVHRKDFEMEQECRQTAVQEKQQILQDLRNLQRKNQELIEEHQKIAENYQKRLSTVGAGDAMLMSAAVASAESYINNPQRPIRVSHTLPSPSSVPAAPTTAPPVAMHLCPICNKAFRTLHILTSHVNDCIDKN